MREVIVKKTELLEKVKANLNVHKAEHKEAITLMQEEVKKYHQAQLRNIKKGEKYNLHFRFDVPENHENDYEQIINMLEMTVDDEIELSYTEFTQYVMDSWSWTQSFKMSATNYGATVSNFSS